MDALFTTILTPTYNRASHLSRLYHSLLEQSCPDFEWLIIDDGSTDNTSELIHGFILEKKLNIRYFCQSNQGKHTAVNLGTEHAKGELIFIVDSDDYLTSDALSIIHSHWLEIPTDTREQYAGIGALRAYSGHKIVGTIMDGEHFDTTYWDFRNKYKIQGDKAEVYRRDLLKQFPFPVFQGERFLTEAVVWNKISQEGYILRWINKIVYICEYLEGGLSNRYVELMYQNPRGYAYYFQHAQNGNLDFHSKLYLNYNYYMCCCIASEPIWKSLKNDTHKLFALMGLPVGVVKFLIKYREIKKFRKYK